MGIATVRFGAKDAKERNKVCSFRGVALGFLSGCGFSDSAKRVRPGDGGAGVVCDL